MTGFGIILLLSFILIAQVTWEFMKELKGKE